MLDVSERRVCRVLGQHRSTQRKVPCGADDEQALTDDIVALAKQYGRYGSLRDELLNGEIFYSLAEARVLIEAWRCHYNTVRPHSSLGYCPPAPEAATPPLPASGSASLHLRPTMAAATTMH